MGTRIDCADVWHVPVALRRGHVMSFGTAATADLIVVRLTDSDGAQGWGEATVLGGPYWSEESAESVFATLAQYLLPGLVNRPVDSAAAHLDGHVRQNPFAKAALEIALGDLRARRFGIALAAMWGAHTPAPLALSWSLAAGTIDDDLREAGERAKAGQRIFKIKAGAQAVDQDVERIAAVRELLGPEVSLRVDANQGWTRPQAARALSRLNGLDLAFVEQPLRRDDRTGLAALQAGTDIPLAADESLRTLSDAIALSTSDAARVFVYKPAKHGGIARARQVAAVAEACGIEGYLGCMIESSIGTAAYLAFAMSGVPLAYGCELFGPQLLVDDLTEEPVQYENGAILPTTGPGLGIQVDAEKVRALAVRHSQVRASD